MTKLGTPIEEVTLPTWTDAASVTSYITSLVAGAVAIIAAIHPGFTEPPVIPQVIPGVGLVVAGVAQIANLVYHRKATIAAILKKNV